MSQIKRLEFSIDIKADATKIWKALWSDQGYRAWAAVFYEGSYIVIDKWEEGSTIHFLGADKSGIYSVIEKYRPSEMIKFKHVGNVKEGVTQPLDSETLEWSGATEVYQIKRREGFNILQVQLDVMDEHFDFMTKTFPKALEVIKANSRKVL